MDMNFEVMVDNQTVSLIQNIYVVLLEIISDFILALIIVLSDLQVQITSFEGLDRYIY